MAYEISFAGIFACSAFAACFAEFCTLPFDTAKVRLQLQKGAASGEGGGGGAKYKGLLGTMVTIAKEEGIFALWKGVIPGLHRQFLYGGLRIGLYEPVKAFIIGSDHVGEVSLFSKILAALLTGAIAIAVANPTDLVKVRLQAESKAPVGAPRRYIGAMDAYYTIVKQEGLTALWTGLGPNIARNAIINAAELASYDHVKETILKIPGFTDSALTHILAGLGAGFFAVCIGSPVDVGPFAFYKGFLPNFTRLGLWNVIMFLTFERSLRRPPEEENCVILRKLINMSYSKRSRYSRSPSYKHYSSRSVSRSLSKSPSLSRSPSRSRYSGESENPGNNLYVTGLATRVREKDLEKHFSSEGKVEDVHLVVDPWTRESRGFAFVTMSKLEDADRCIKYLNRSVLEGRVITVEKARRRRGRTPTPGRYLGLRTVRERRSPSYSRSRSPRYSSERDRSRSRSRSYSPYYRRRRRSYSPHYSRRSRHSYSPYGRGRSYSRSVSRSPSNSPYYSRYRSPDDGYYYRRSSYRSPDDRDYYYRRSQRYRSISRSISPPRYRRYRRSYSPSVSPRRRRRSYSRSVSPPSKDLRVCPRKSSRRSGYDSCSSRSHSRSTSASSRSHSRSVMSDSTLPSP
nr:mitochondrial uncoupling protein 2-like [Ipomoea trifida]